MQEAVKLYGTKTAIAKELGISPAAVTNWQEHWGNLVPKQYAYELEVKSRGAVRVVPFLYENAGPPKSRGRYGPRNPNKAGAFVG